MGNKGPVTVLVGPVSESFWYYKSGVYPGCRAHQQFPGFAYLLLVGYGNTTITTPYHTRTEKFWILKNSWGSDWGINGYMWLDMVCGTNLLLDNQSLHLLL